MESKLYDDLTKVIFERHPRIKGVYCASIAYGLIDYLEKRASPAALGQQAAAKPDEQALTMGDYLNSDSEEAKAARRGTVDYLQGYAAGKEAAARALGHQAAAMPVTKPSHYRVGVDGEWFYGSEKACRAARAEYEASTGEAHEEPEACGPIVPAQAAQPVAWIATDLDGRAAVAFPKEEAKRQAGEGCTEFIPLFDVPELSGEAAGVAAGLPFDLRKIQRWTFDGGMTAQASKDGQWLAYSDLAWRVAAGVAQPVASADARPAGLKLWGYSDDDEYQGETLDEFARERRLVIGDEFDVTEGWARERRFKIVGGGPTVADPDAAFVFEAVDGIDRAAIAAPSTSAGGADA